jgi:hypothetical protein
MVSMGEMPGGGPMVSEEETREWAHKDKINILIGGNELLMEPIQPNIRTR